MASLLVTRICRVKGKVDLAALVKCENVIPDKTKAFSGVGE